MNNKKHDVNLLGRVGYGMCNFGMNIIATIVGAFVTMYYTDNVMLSAAFVGTMLMGISTQLFHTSRAGVAMLAVMFAAGFVLFQLAVRAGDA